MTKRYGVNNMGRSPRYEKEIKPHLEKIREAVEAGATVEEIADAFDIAEGTLYKYKKQNKELAEVFNKGRKVVVFEIKNAMKKAALGYFYEEEKVYIKKDEDGNPVKYSEKQKKYAKPDVNAAKMMLNVLDPNWVNDDAGSIMRKEDEIELKRQIANTNVMLNFSDNNSDD